MQKALMLFELGIKIVTQLAVNMKNLREDFKMAVVIRMARVGTKHEPKYRIAVADSRRYVTGKYLEVIGTYIPVPSGKDQKVVIDLEKYNSWVKKGAQPTDRVKYAVKLAMGASK